MTTTLNANPENFLNSDAPAVAPEGIGGLASHYNSQGELCLGLARDPLLTQVKADYERPFYIYDLQGLRARAKLYRQSVATAKSFYAVKANTNREILRVLHEEGFGCDVVSGGELERALDAGFLPQQIVFSGVGKTLSEVRLAFERGIYQINAESVPELLRLQQIAALKLSSSKNPLRVALRYNPDVNVNTHKYISTGLKENKFGMADEELTEALLLFANGQFPDLTLVGLSMHLGSQIRELDSIQEGLRRLVQKTGDLQSRFSTIDTLDVGGGLGIDYHSDSFESELTMLKTYGQILKTEIPKNLQAETEPGRILVARSGALIAQVQYVKIRNDRRFLVLDAGMNHLMRPALYQAHHRVQPLKINSAKVQKYDVVGPICESSDVFGRNFTMNEVKEGDFVAILDAGAYGHSMANTYNLHQMPEERFLSPASI